ADSLLLLPRDRGGFTVSRLLCGRASKLVRYRSASKDVRSGKRRKKSRPKRAGTRKPPGAFAKTNSGSPAFQRTPSRKLRGGGKVSTLHAKRPPRTHCTIVSISSLVSWRMPSKVSRELQPVSSRTTAESGMRRVVTAVRIDRAREAASS